MSWFEDFLRVFSNPLDTQWWFGKTYHDSFGQRWPHEGEEPPEGYVYPTLEGYKHAVMGAVAITFLRYIVETLIAERIGYYLGIRHKLDGTPPAKNPNLEAFLKSHNYKKPSAEDIATAARDQNMEVREVEVWIRRRQRERVPSKLNKFKESFWRFCFYTFAFVYGLVVLWPEDFLWDTRYCWVGFPDLIWAVKKKIYYYYLFEASFYLSLMGTQFFDTKRKDFWEMFIHHIATLMLIGFSYSNGTSRIGALVMVTHDISDVFLEGSKLAIYCKCNAVANVGFACFTLSWLVARLMYYPYRVIYHGYWYIPILNEWPVVYVYLVFLLSLLGLHVFWFKIILGMAIHAICNSSDIDKDDRSDASFDSLSDSTDKSSKLKQKN